MQRLPSMYDDDQRPRQIMVFTECSICLETFADVGQRLPKLLPCGHTLCLECARSKCPRPAGLQCPFCVKLTTAIRDVDSLPSNVAVIEMIARKSARGPSQPSQLIDRVPPPYNRSVEKAPGNDKIENAERVNNNFGIFCIVLWVVIVVGLYLMSGGDSSPSSVLTHDLEKALAMQTDDKALLRHELINSLLRERLSAQSSSPGHLSMILAFIGNLIYLGFLFTIVCVFFICCLCAIVLWKSPNLYKDVIDWCRSYAQAQAMRNYQHD